MFFTCGNAARFIPATKSHPRNLHDDETDAFFTEENCNHAVKKMRGKRVAHKRNIFHLMNLKTRVIFPNTAFLSREQIERK